MEKWDLSQICLVQNLKINIIQISRSKNLKKENLYDTEKMDKIQDQFKIKNSQKNWELKEGTSQLKNIYKK